MSDDEALPVHKPREKQDHVAQEYHAKGDVAGANDLIRNLPRRHKAAVLPESWQR